MKSSSNSNKMSNLNKDEKADIVGARIENSFAPLSLGHIQFRVTFETLKDLLGLTAWAVSRRSNDEVEKLLLILQLLLKGHLTLIGQDDVVTSGLSGSTSSLDHSVK